MKKLKIVLAAGCVRCGRPVPRHRCAHRLAGVYNEAFSFAYMRRLGAANAGYAPDADLTAAAQMPTPTVIRSMLWKKRSSRVLP